MVIDSHALLWWLEDDPRLSAAGKDLLDSAESTDGVWIISPVSFWELRLKELRGLIQARQPISSLPAVIEMLPWLKVVPPDSEIWLTAADLEWAHRDPADRLIAATALGAGLPVLTADHKFHAPDSPVKAVW